MRTTIFKRLSVLSLSLLLPLALACGGGETGGEMEAGGGEEAAEQPASQPGMSSAATPETASLQAMGESGVSGQVDFTREGDQLEVHVTAQNVAGPGDHASHIHQGTCASPGGVVTALNAVAVAEGGMGEATTTVDATQLEAGGDYLVMVHGSEGAPIACAGVPAAVTEGGGM